VNGTLVLSIGETIEEVQDTGFLSSAPTLAVQQIGADALLQVHPHGIRHVLSDRRVNEWKVPQGKTIVSATTNKRQVVVALSSAELVYFELDLDGQLNEYQDRKAMGSTVLALSIGEVPEGRQRTPYLVSVDIVLIHCSLTSYHRLWDVKTRPFVSSPWTPKVHLRR
jgi:splicing factor 3B subunit 3